MRRSTPSFQQGSEDRNAAAFQGHGRLSCLPFPGAAPQSGPSPEALYSHGEETGWREATPHQKAPGTCEESTRRSETRQTHIQVGSQDRFLVKRKEAEAWPDSADVPWSLQGGARRVRGWEGPQAS